MMDIGMLWFDNDPKSGLTIKIERAADYYRTKYGRSPNLCFVHPSMVKVEVASPETAIQVPESKDETSALKSGGVEVRTSRSVLPNHFWIGVNGTITPSES
jgi:hypothetical protein